MTTLKCVLKQFGTTCQVPGFKKITPPYWALERGGGGVRNDTSYGALQLSIASGAFGLLIKNNDFVSQFCFCSVVELIKFLCLKGGKSR